MTIAVDTNYNVNPMIRETARSAGRSFFSGFVLNALISGMNYTQGMAGGSISALVVLIDKVARLLLLNFFGSGYSGTLEEIVVRNVIVFAAATAAATALGPMIGMSITIDLAYTLYVKIIANLLLGPGSFMNNLVII